MLKKTKKQDKNISLQPRYYIILVLAILCIVGVSAATNYEYHTTTDSINTIYAEHWIAQGFEIGEVGAYEDINLGRVSINLGGGTTGYFNVSIREADTAGQPTGGDLSNGSILANTITVTGWYNISMTAVTLDKTKNYTIVMSAPTGSVDLRREVAGTYGGGNQSHSVDYGATWITYEYDAGFEIWGTAGNVSVLLNSPPDKNSSMNNLITFDATIIPEEYFNVTNATIYIWDNDGNLYNQTTNIINGNVGAENQTTWDINLSYNKYEWNVLGCVVNSTNAAEYSCDLNPSNYSLISGTIINSFIYNLTTLENSIEEMSINLTIDGIYYTDAIADLYYNNTKYTGTKAEYGTNLIFTTNVSVPVVSVDPTDIDFYWTVGFINGSGVNYINTSSYTQSVSKVFLDLCGAAGSNVTLNFTAYNEQNLSRINNFSFYATFNYGSYYTKGNNLSVDKIDINEVSICLSPENQTIYTDAIIEYTWEDDNNTYVKRNYYFQNGALTNTTQDINLFLLNAEESTSFIIKVQDQKLSPVTNALVYIQRYYPQDGLYRTVQIAKTDDNGETLGFYETEDVDYKHIITKDGVVLLETASQKVVGKEVPYTLTFTTGVAGEYPWTPWEGNESIQTSLSFNSTTNITTFAFVDVSGATTAGGLIVLQESSNNATIKIICNDSVSSSSGTLTCDLTLYSGTFTAKGWIGTENNVVDIITFVITTAKEIFGRTGLIIGWFIILTAGMAFIWNPTAGVVGINAALWFVSFMGFITFSYIFLFAIMAVSIITIWMLKT